MVSYHNREVVGQAQQPLEQEGAQEAGERVGGPDGAEAGDGPPEAELAAALDEDLLGLEPELVEVTLVPNGGGFGGKEEYPSVIAIGPRAGTLLVAYDYMTGLGVDIAPDRDGSSLGEIGQRVEGDRRPHDEGFGLIGPHGHGHVHALVADRGAEPGGCETGTLLQALQ